MEIKQIDGDLLQSQADIIAHQVNCQGAMRAGVAKAIREKYPIVYDNYVSYVDDLGKTDILGTIQLIKVNDNQYVANLFGQRCYGFNRIRYTSYDAIYNCLEALVKHMTYNHFKTVAFPYGMSCGYGGANWGIIYKMIEETFKNTDITVEIYKL